MKLYAFISYQTADREVAGKIKDLLSTVGISAFLAHEDINVSEEWRLKILEEIGKADLFICLLSRNYLASPWCVQESGIAAFKNEMTIIPLSLDGTIPIGFISHVQSTKIDPPTVSIKNLLPGLIKYDFQMGIDMIIKSIKASRSFRGAEANFELVLPYLGKMNNEQMKALLETAASNNQVHHAGACAHDYIPPLLESHGHLLNQEDLEFLQNVCARYA